MKRSYTLEFEQGDLTMRIVRHQSELSENRAEVEIEVTSNSGNGSGNIWLTGESQLFLLKEAIDNYIEVFHLKKEGENHE